MEDQGTKELSRERYVRLKKQQTSSEIWLSERRYEFNKRGSLLTTLQSNSLNLMCHAHKRNATEVTKVWLK